MGNKRSRSEDKSGIKHKSGWSGDAWAKCIPRCGIWRRDLGGCEDGGWMVGGLRGDEDGDEDGERVDGWTGS
jgi:hypothetical protein